MATDPLNTWIFGGNDGLTYEELLRRRAIATALASRGKGFPKNLGEGLTYFGESVGEAIGDWRLREMERRQKEKEGGIQRDAPTSGGYTPPDQPPAPSRPPPQRSYAPPAPPPEPPPAPPPAPAPVSEAPATPDVPPDVVADTSAAAFAPRFDQAFTSTAAPEPAPPAQQVAERFAPAMQQPLTRAMPSRNDLVFDPQQAQGGVQTDVSNLPAASFAGRTYDDQQLATLNAPLSPVKPPPELAQAPQGPPQGPQGAPPGPLTMPTAAVNPPVDPRAPRPGGPPMPPPQPVAAATPPTSPPPFEGPQMDPRSQARMAAIKGIESSGGDYQKIHATTPTGDRAQGAYGIMGRNVGPWTEKALGYRMTPEQFRNSRNAQDITFRQKFEGEYVPKYGDEGAARAWYGGERGMKNLAATDQHGRLSVAGYRDDYLNRLGGGGANPREAVTAALMQQQQGPPSEREIASEALMQEVLGGGGNKRGFPATAALGRGGIQSDAPLPGIGGVGTATDEGIGAAIKARQNIYNAVQQQQLNVDPPVPEVPQPDPTQSGVTPPATSTSSTSTGDRTAQVRGLGTIDDSGLVISGGRPLGPSLPPPDPSQGITPAPQGLPPSAEPIPGAVPQTMPDPGDPPKRPDPLGLSPVQKYWLPYINNPNVSPALQKRAEREFATEEKYRQTMQEMQNNDYIDQREAWQKKKADKDKFDREAHDRVIEQQTKRLSMEKLQQDLQTIGPLEAAVKQADLALKRAQVAGIPTEVRKAELAVQQAEATLAETMQRVNAGRAPPREKIGERILERQQDGTWKDVTPGENMGNIKLTDAQAKQLKFFERTTMASSQLGDAAVLAGLMDTARGKVPIGGNYWVSPAYQRANSAADAWIESTLRDVSGAAIRDEEYPTQKRIYFPQPGDSEQVIRDKAARRQNAERGLYDGLGTARPIADKFVEEFKARTLQGADKAALDWAKANPDDPRALEIRRRLGVP